MFFVFALALAGLFLIFLEFFLPGAVMAVGGSLLLMTSLFFFYMEKLSIPFLIAYLIGLMGAVYAVIKIALWQVRATGKKGTIFLENDQEGFQASLYPKELIGQVGSAATDLKPSGQIFVGGQMFQALSKDGYIDKGAPIEVLGGHGFHLIVKNCNTKVEVKS